MTDKIKDGGPAFPRPYSARHEDDESHSQEGMTLRDWIAGQVLVALGDTNPNLPGSRADSLYWPVPEELAARRAQWAVLQADALIAALGARP